MTPRLVLVGPPGAGKTLVGRRVAERLQVSFLDTDHDIAASAGKPIREIFAEDGEEHFRELERQAVARALEDHDGVLSLGGGAVLSKETRRRLRSHNVVLLSASPSVAAERIRRSRSRPVLGPDPHTALQALLQERTPLYLEVARSVVETNHKLLDDVAREVLALVTQ